MGSKKTKFIAAGIFLAFVAWGLWTLQPWMPANRAVFLGKWQFGDTEFQVWQRKNAELTEPFATGLFVRKATNQWRVYCINIDDYYSPSIKLRQEGSQIAIFKSSTRDAVFDLTTQTYRRESNPTPYGAAGIGAGHEPPGDWWVKVCAPISFDAPPLKSGRRMGHVKRNS